MFKPFTCKGIWECYNNHACFAFSKNRPGEQKMLAILSIETLPDDDYRQLQECAKCWIQVSRSPQLVCCWVCRDFIFLWFWHIEVPIYVSEPGFFAVVGEMQKLIKPLSLRPACKLFCLSSLRFGESFAHQFEKNVINMIWLWSSSVRCLIVQGNSWLSKICDSPAPVTFMQCKPLCLLGLCGSKML